MSGFQLPFSSRKSAPRALPQIERKADIVAEVDDIIAKVERALYSNSVLGTQRDMENSHAYLTGLIDEQRETIAMALISGEEGLRRLDEAQSKIDEALNAY